MSDSPLSSTVPPAGAERPIVVQKYGGTSVGDLERIVKVAQRIARSVRDGNRVAVTVSAMGRSTDRLIGMAKQLAARPDRRELDVLMSTGEQQSIALLAIALQQTGLRARSFTGQQAGFVTTDLHGAARIVEVDPARMRAALDDHDVVVVAGFQGVHAGGDITTLGRGGSDTTAVAVAAALGATSCEIYTDTEGIYTTDPHRVPSATKLERIDYDEMLELAALGATVLHPRSVWYARRYGVAIHVRSSFSYNPGTFVVAVPEEERRLITDKPVTGVALDVNHVRVDIVGVPDTPGVAGKIFGALGAAGVSADMIIQGVPGVSGSRQQLSFTVDLDLVDDALDAVRPVITALGGSAEADPDVAKLSIVGIAIGSTPGVAATMFDAVAGAGANIEMIATSEVRISVVIPQAAADAALKAVHRAFGLDSDAASASAPAVG